MCVLSYTQNTVSEPVHKLTTEVNSELQNTVSKPVHKLTTKVNSELQNTVSKPVHKLLTEVNSELQNTVSEPVCKLTTVNSMLNSLDLLPSVDPKPLFTILEVQSVSNVNVLSYYFR